MKLRLLDLLACPTDNSPLELIQWETTTNRLSADETRRLERMGVDPASFLTEVVTGVLINREKKLFYPIHEGVPRMLVFPTAVARHFEKKYASRITAELPGFTLPNRASMPGEDTVLQSFSTEWVNYDWDGGSYWNLSPDAMYETTKFLLDLGRRPVQDKLVLEVGIGIGGIADYMARTQQCELVGIDLSHAVDPAYRHFGGNPFLHIIQSSAFAPPFCENTFDLVYSHGVLHHTFSTKKAFEGVCKLPKTGGRLYIWVYSFYDESRTLERRMLMRLESLIRPIVWRLPSRWQTFVLLPIIPFYLVRQNVFRDRRKAGSIGYGLREALHAARDRFTPRYVHRHTDEEVCSWFVEAGYTQLQCLSKRERQDFIPIAYQLATAVDGIRC